MSDQGTRTRKNDTHDAKAARIARAFLAGEKEESEARWEIAGVLEDTGVVSSIATRRFDRAGKAGVEDAAGVLADIARNAITGYETSGGVRVAPKLDLRQLAGGASFCGWARGFLTSQQALATASRKVTPARDRIIDAIDIEARNVGVVFRAITQDPAVAVCGVGARADDIADAFVVASANKRSVGNSHLRALAICKAWHLPTPARSIDADDRPRRLAAVEADERAVCDGLRGIGDVPVVDLFADWSDGDIATLLELPPHVGQALAISALTPEPPPQASHVAALRQRLVEALGSRKDVRELVKAFVALASEATTSEFDAHRAFAAKDADERRSDRERFNAAAAALLARGERRLGTTPDDVERRLTRMLDTIRYGAVLAS